MLMRLYRLLRGTLPLVAVLFALADSAANGDVILRVINSLDRPVTVSYDGKVDVKISGVGERFFIDLRIGTPAPP